MPSSWGKRTVSLSYGGYTILAYPVVEKGDHPIGIHGFTGVEFKIFEVCDNFLGIGRGSFFKSFDTVRIRLPELSLDDFHVALEISQIGLLVECGGLESEGMDDVVNLSSPVLQSILLLLSRRVSA